MMVKCSLLMALCIVQAACTAAQGEHAAVDVQVKQDAVPCAAGTVAAAGSAGGCVSCPVGKFVGVDVPAAYKLSIPTAAVGKDNAGDQVNHFKLDGHGLADNNPVVYHAGGGTAITGLTDGTIYYVRGKTTNGFGISLTAGGASVAFDKNNAGNNEQFFEKMLYMPTANVGVNNDGQATASTFKAPAHGLNVNAAVRYRGGGVLW